MTHLALTTLVTSFLTATSALAFDPVMSPFDVSQAEADLAAGVSATPTYDFSPRASNPTFNGDALGVTFIDQNEAFGPEVPLIETGTRDGAGFRLGVGYDVSNSAGPSLDGRRDANINALQNRFSNRTTTSSSGLAAPDDDDLSLNLGFRLNF